VATLVNLGSFEHVRTDPYRCSEWLTESGVVDGATVTVSLHDHALTILDVRFDAPPDEHLPGYPPEHVRVTVTSGADIVTVPVAERLRCWHHRYPDHAIRKGLQPGNAPIAWENLLGGLCLWYPLDPPHLRWSWEKGIDMYLHIVRRHLWSEEYYRRHGTWPVEDAPHGERPDGKSHPVLTSTLRSA